VNALHKFIQCVGFISVLLSCSQKKSLKSVTNILLWINCFKKYGSYDLCSNNGTPHINFLTMMDTLEVHPQLYCSNTYSFQQSYTHSDRTKFYHWKMWVLGQENCHKPHAKTSYKNVLSCNCLFNHWNMFCFIWPWLAQHSFLAYLLLLRQTQLIALLSPMWKSLMNHETNATILTTKRS
jgi:hypothetical protein